MPKPARHVLVCGNTRPPTSRGSCGEKGSDRVFERLKALVREAGLGGQVMVTRTGCLKHCSRGVTVVVHPDNVFYAGVREEDVGEICEAHLRGGRPVERLLMPDVPWE